MLVGVDGWCISFPEMKCPNLYVRRNACRRGEGISRLRTRTNMYEVHLSWDVGQNATISGEEVDPDCSWLAIARMY
jgi:hypothetical protein